MHALTQHRTVWARAHHTWASLDVSNSMRRSKGRIRRRNPATSATSATSAPKAQPTPSRAEKGGEESALCVEGVPKLREQEECFETESPDDGSHSARLSLHLNDQALTFRKCQATISSARGQPHCAIFWDSLTGPKWLPTLKDHLPRIHPPWFVPDHIRFV